jgi:hypothetical protein
MTRSKITKRSFSNATLFIIIKIALTSNTVISIQNYDVNNTMSNKKMEVCGRTCNIFLLTIFCRVQDALKLKLK